MWKLMLAASLLWSAAATAEKVDLLVYEVKEEGLPKYLSRILVSDAFVRIDEGESSANGYTLYNRVSHRIHNVDPEEETVLILRPPDRQPVPPESLRLEAKLKEEPLAPGIGGRQTRRLELYADGRLCRTLQVVPGIMPRAVQGLRELRLALARLQGDSAVEPKADPCELAEYLYAPTRHLAHGLPLLDVMTVKRQVLVDFDPAFETSERLFEVPADYEVVTPPPL